MPINPPTTVFRSVVVKYWNIEHIFERVLVGNFAEPIAVRMCGRAPILEPEKITARYLPGTTIEP